MSQDSVLIMNAVGTIIHVDLIGHACVDIVYVLVLNSSEFFVGYFRPSERVGRDEACSILSGEVTASVLSWYLRRVFLQFLVFVI